MIDVIRETLKRSSCETIRRWLVYFVFGCSSIYIKLQVSLKKIVVPHSKHVKEIVCLHTGRRGVAHILDLKLFQRKWERLGILYEVENGRIAEIEIFKIIVLFVIIIYLNYYKLKVTEKIIEHSDRRTT